VIEGNSGYTDIEINVTVMESFGADLEFHYQTYNGEATTADNDYLPVDGTFTFEAHDTPLATWSTTVLTTTETNDYDYGSDGQFIVWEGYDGNDWEIYLFAGKFDAENKPIIHQLTDNETDDRETTVFAGTAPDGTAIAMVAWAGIAEGGTDTEIFLYRGSFDADGTLLGTPTTDRLTGNADNIENVFDDHAPQISERYVTWWANDGQSNEVFFYDLIGGGSIQSLTENSFSDKDPIVQGSNIVWLGDRGNGSEIFLFEGEYDEYNEPIITRITNNFTNDQAPQIDGDYIVWEGYQGNLGQIFLYQISTATTTQITPGLYSNRYPQISGNDIVWQCYDGYDWEIYHYNIEAGTAPVDISMDFYSADERPEILNGKVVWRSSSTIAKEVHYYDLHGDEPITVISDTSESAWYPHITENMAVWRSYNGTNYDIVMATQNEPEITDTVTLRIVGDTKIENDESFFVTFQALEETWVEFDDSEAKIIILNDDGQIDYGDAPASYSTLLVDNGARHKIGSFPARLGQLLDVESNAYASSNSLGDDNMGQDDEDGVTFTTALGQDSTAIISVEVSLPAGADPNQDYYLDAWIDFKGEGNWDGLDDKIFDGQPLSLGTNTLSFEVPADAVPGLTHARFRLSSTGGLDYTGQVDGGEVEDYQVQILAKPDIEDKTINLTGTSGDDTFIFTAGSTLTVNINGVDYMYNPSEIEEITFDGGAGNDTAIFNGSSTAESVEFWPKEGDFIGNGYTVSVSDIESLNAVAGNSDDTITMHGSINDDAFLSLPESDYATLTGTGFAMQADAFNHLDVFSEGGNDQAKLYGSTGNDVYSASPDHGQMQSLGITTDVNYFRYLSGYAISGGEDQAFFEDSDQGRADKFSFTVNPDNLADLQGQDAYVPTIQSMATLVNNYGLSLSAYNFTNVSATSTSGIDEANMEGSPGEDRFIGSPVGFNPDTSEVTGGSYAKLTGDHEGFEYLCIVNEFRYASAAAKSDASEPLQDDVAFLYDSPGSDTLTASPTYSKIAGEGFYYRADYFKKVNAYSDNGGEDIAVLYDSAGDDSFIGAPDVTRLYANDGSYAVYANTFRHITAYAKYGGENSALLFGSAGDDTYLATPDYGKMTREAEGGGQSFYRAYYFQQVEAYAMEGNDVAYLMDSEYPDLLTAHGSTVEDNTFAALSNDGYGDFYYEVNNFDEVHATSTSSGDQKDVDEAVDFLFTQGYWLD
jgi:beta propeller repeat protein